MFLVTRRGGVRNRQVSAQIDRVIPANEIIEEFIQTYNEGLKNLREIN